MRGYSVILVICGYLLEDSSTETFWLNPRSSWGRACGIVIPMVIVNILDLTSGDRFDNTGLFRAADGSRVLYFILYSLGFSMFSPCGAKHLNRWVHRFSTLLRITTDCGLRGGFLMNSRTLISTSLTPLWLV